MSVQLSKHWRLCIFYKMMRDLIIVTSVGAIRLTIFFLASSHLIALGKAWAVHAGLEILFWGKIRKVQVKEEGSHKISLYASFFSVYFAF